MRVLLSSKDRVNLFEVLKERGIDLRQVAEISSVSIRTVTDWKRGKYTIPKDHFDRIINLIGISPGSIKVSSLDNWWNNSKSGKLGAAARMEKHGQLSTPEGRSLGGKNSYKNRKNKLDIFTKKEITEPRQNEQFAELVGILIGDGSVTRYQVSIATSSLVDYKYSLFTAELIEKLFGIKPTVSKRKGMNCITIVASSVNLVEFLKQNGVLQGHKLRQNLNIPAWILSDRSYEIACLRGIFDTDGCIFQETHKIKGKTYSYSRLSFVSMSSYLRETIHEILSELEFTPKIRNNRSVNLENPADIAAYFRIVGTSNPKHASRFQAFGGVG